MLDRDLSSWMVKVYSLQAAGLSCVAAFLPVLSVLKGGGEVPAIDEP